jgi:D-alanyl-D-alanine carboxypeptidase (penicillin-binding protein 5/6)
MKFVKRCIVAICLFNIIFLNVNCFADVENEDEINSLESIETNSDNTYKAPKVLSKYAICIERTTGTILFENDAYEKTAMASTTKIMTAIIAIEKGNLNDIVTISKKAAQINGSRLDLRENMQISLKDLLYGLMLRSGNDAAIAIAEYISGSTEEFAVLMNEKAKSLGMNNSHFVTPNGLDDDQHYSTAYDMAVLTNYALNNKVFAEIVGTKKISINWNGNSREISNTNELLGNYNGVYGVKTGFTFGAGRCLISACKRNGLDVIVVVLGANTKKDRTNDSVKILNYVNSSYEMVDISSIIMNSFEKGSKYFEENVKYEKIANKAEIELKSMENTIYPILKNKISKITSKSFLMLKISNNMQKNTKIGIVQIYVDSKLLVGYDIILSNAIVKKDAKYYISDILKNYCRYFCSKS